MIEQYKYWRKRLTAKEVLQLYAGGERDFRGAILAGRNFRGADLSGADFSQTNIRGTQFVEATLIGTQFCYAEAGQSSPWLILRLLTGLLAVPGGFCQAVANAYIGAFLVPPSIIASAVHFGTFVAVVAVAVVAAVVIVGTRVIAGANATVAAAVTAILTAPFAALLASFSAAFNFYVSTGDESIAAVFVAFAIVLIITIAIVIANFRLSRYVERLIRHDPNWENLRNLLVVGGTAFNGANLTNASFANAALNRTNFANSERCSTILTHVRWQGARQLDQVHPGTSNLWDPRVRHLLTYLKGLDHNGQAPLDLYDVDLRGSNLAGAKLHRIDLKRANLNGATLAGAELPGANLTRARCLGTDFTAAHLTGACLEGWHIDHTTVFQGIDCQYVFLKERPFDNDYGDRRPRNPDDIFQPGDCEQFFSR
ncbi:MAG: pentapeptide repeat-containing protein [Leptolyngbyaceae cyanobacterium]